MKHCDDQSTNLDPLDWNAFRTAAHDVLDCCIERLEAVNEHPWKPVPDEQRCAYDISERTNDVLEIAQRLKEEVLPYATGNTHPRFFGWVHGSGLVSGLLSELVAATMNSNCGGRDHGAVYIERAVVEWSRKTFGYPESASGILVSGSSQATLIALAVARFRSLGPTVRTAGLGNVKLTAYAGSSVHSSIKKAMELLGIGSEGLRLIPESELGMCIDALSSKIRLDRENGFQPFAIIATCGSVDLGRFDDLNSLADFAQEEGLWLHVDGAFGAWTRLAKEPWNALADGIERTDSIACDFHKLMYVQYDCGMALVRDSALHRAAFSSRPSYLKGQRKGLGAGEPWFCDFGVDLSRGNRALKVWTALQHYGEARLGAAISANCEQARLMADLISSRRPMRVMAPVISNICVFTANATLMPNVQSSLNTSMAEKLQIDGEAVLSTTSIDGIICLRAAITNHRTTFEDIESTVSAVARSRDMIEKSSKRFEF